MEQEKVNRLGTEPVRKLLLKTGLPVILSMVLQAVYNIVDSAFATNMQTGGETAVFSRLSYRCCVSLCLYCR